MAGGDYFLENFAPRGGRFYGGEDLLLHRPACGNTGRLFLAFGGPVCADRFSNCPLDRMY